jgi:chemotaxis signal transduction protein
LPAPETLDGPLRDSCRAAWDLSDELLLELDPEKLLRGRETEAQG